MISNEAMNPVGHSSVQEEISHTILHHVSNSDALVQFPLLFGIDFSLTKHVFMLWIVSGIVFFVLYLATRQYRNQEYPVPRGLANAIEAVVVFLRDQLVVPSMGRDYVRVWGPLIFSLFFFILTANLAGLIPIFDLIPGGSTATGNFNVTAGLATVTFFSIIFAGSLKHGFIGYWKHVAPAGLPFLMYFILIPIEIIGMFVKPFALTMRLAANMTGGHIALLSVTSFIFLFGEKFNPLAGIAVGAFVSVPLNVAISALEVIIALIQAYVFTLLSSIFIGLAIQPHH